MPPETLSSSGWGLPHGDGLAFELIIAPIDLTREVSTARVCIVLRARRPGVDRVLIRTVGQPQLPRGCSIGRRGRDRAGRSTTELLLDRSLAYDAAASIEFSMVLDRTDRDQQVVLELDRPTETLATQLSFPSTERPTAVTSQVRRAGQSRPRTAVTHPVRPSTPVVQHVQPNMPAGTMTLRW